MRQVPIPLLLCTVLTLPAGEAVQLSVLGESLVAAGVPARIGLTAAPDAPLAWTVADWSGRAEASGQAIAGHDGRAGIMLSLPAGWHELTVNGARFGVIASDPALAGAPDSFFAVDAALAWLVPDAGRRAALTAMAPRLGLAMARERLSWNAIQPAAERFDGVVHHDNDRLRATWTQAGMPLLEVFHDAPAWLGRSSGAYPADLLAAARSWTRLGQRWAASTAAVEVWNEPELTGFSKGGAPEHLVALTQAVAWGLRQSAPQVLVGGGVLTSSAPAGFRQRLWRDGLLAPCDFLSFHHYGDPRNLEGHLLRLRQELAEAGEPAMPLWITESGKPWPRGTDRPERAADLTSAAAIALRAIEAKACGVARHFAFVLPYYPENINNFGLTGRDGTALRSLAAYSHAARRLAGLAYRGDLAVPGAVRARLFADAQRAVAVVWLGDPDPQRAFTPGFPVVAAHGLDGRLLLPVADGALPVADGVVFLSLAPGSLPPVQSGIAMQLSRAAAARRERPRPSSIVLSPRTIPGVCEPSPRGWSLPGARIGITVWNLAAEQRELLLALRPPAHAAVRDGAERPVQVPAGGSMTVEWRIEPGPDGGSWRIEALDDPDVRTIDLAEWRDLDGEAVLRAVPPAHRRALTAAERTAVDRNLAAGASLEATAEGTLSRLRFDFAAAGDRWAYPRLRLPADVRLQDFDAMLIRMRCLRPAEVRFFAFEGGAGWFTSEALIPADGAWHWTLVRLRDLDYCEATPADPDGRFDLAKVELVSLGCNSQEAANTIEVSAWELVRLGGAVP